MIDQGPRAGVERDYRTLVAERRASLARQEQVHARLSHVRLALAGVFVALLALYGLDAAWWLVGLFAIFLVVAIVHARLLNARDNTKSAIQFFERGLARLSHNWIGHGRTGEEFRQADHLYADDLDVFGRGSLFELLATARTKAGEEMLAKWLLEPAPLEIARARQVAIRELAGRLELREAVAVLGDSARVGVDAPILRAWARAPRLLRGEWPRLGLALLVLVVLPTVVWLAQNDQPPAVALAVFSVQGLAALLLRSRVTAVVQAVDQPAYDLEVLAGLLRLLERETFASDHLKRVQSAIHGDHDASREIARLSRMVALLSWRLNILFAVPAAFILWTTQWAFAIEAWRAKIGVHIPQWLDAVGEFEALLALGGFAAENPDYPFPELVEGPPRIEATRLAHPVLPATAVGNDFALASGGLQLAIVSGSNMSGKSTWLRAIGTNAVLAMAGAPVRAAAFRMAPLRIGAAIRVQDSLTDGRSRFFAEISRLKQITDLAAAERGAVLFLLDEILSGTNSHDRLIGAEALLVGLVERGAIGLVTTHDLALGKIVDRLPGLADNAHFEDRFVDGALEFDYQLRPGIVKTSNAIALMRSIGLDV